MNVLSILNTICYLIIKRKSIKTFELWIEPLIQISEINIQNIYIRISHLTTHPPHWMITIPEIILSKKPKRVTNPIIYQEELNNIRLHYPNYNEIYTNRSQNNNNTGCAATIKNLYTKLSTKRSIYIQCNKSGPWPYFGRATKPNSLFFQIQCQPLHWLKIGNKETCC